jgi:hypothetical protein
MDGDYLIMGANGIEKDYYIYLKSPHGIIFCLHFEVIYHDRDDNNSDDIYYMSDDNRDPYCQYNILEVEEDESDPFKFKYIRSLKLDIS